MNHCKHCRYSRRKWKLKSGGTLGLWCMFHEEWCGMACDDYEREAGSDDDAGV